MKLGTVVGAVEPAGSAPGFEGVRWTQVRVGEELLVAADPIGSKKGQTVLLALGEAARHWQLGLVTDALVAAVVE